MSEIELPEPFDYITCLNGAATYPQDPIEDVAVYTAEQVREVWRAARNDLVRELEDAGNEDVRAAILAERERCAALRDNVARNYTRHYEVGAKECAAAIRG